jgi:hypothetical protein
VQGRLACVLPASFAPGPAPQVHSIVRPVKPDQGTNAGAGFLTRRLLFGIRIQWRDRVGLAPTSPVTRAVLVVGRSIAR